MSGKKIIDVNIISISPLVQQQNEILLNKLLSYDEQQQQQQKESHSQSSNQTNVSRSKKQKNCICTKNSKTEQLYRKNLSRILKTLNEYINNLIDNFSGKENEEQNTTHLNLENTHTFRLPENNNSSLFLNNTNDLKSLLSTNAKKKRKNKTNMQLHKESKNKPFIQNTSDKHMEIARHPYPNSPYISPE